MSTFFMNLTLPSPRVTAATTWATNINTAVTSVDSHSHISNEGQRLTPSGISVDGNLSFTQNGLTSLGSMVFEPQSSAVGTNNSIFVYNGDLYSTDGSSNDIQMTSGGSLAISAGVGQINGDYSSTGATVFYTDSSLSYTLEDSLGALASVRMAALTCVDITTATNFTTSTISGGALTATTSNLQGTTTVSGATTFTGNTTGRGIIPVGAVVGIATNLTGASIPSSMLELNGQTVSDVDSPMNGVVLPNVSNSNFLMGSTTAGTIGGAATYALLEANLASHTHTIDNSHANTLALSSATTASSSHTHNIAHAHQWAKVTYTSATATFYYRSIDSLDDTTTTITSSNTAYLQEYNNFSGAGTGAARVLIQNDWYTTGVVSPPSGSDGATAASGTPSATQNVTLSGAVTDHSGSSGSTGSGTAISLLPNYITTKYCIRYK